MNDIHLRALVAPDDLYHALGHEATAQVRKVAQAAHDTYLSALAFEHFDGDEPTETIIAAPLDAFSREQRANLFPILRESYAHAHWQARAQSALLHQIEHLTYFILHLEDATPAQHRAMLVYVSLVAARLHNLPS